MSQIDAYTEQTPASGDAALGVTSGGETRLFTLSDLMPPGSVIDFAGSSAPSGFLSCDGSAVSRTTYADLYSAIGVAWGAGDGSTTFNVPDLRGAFTRGAGSHGSETMADGSAFAGPAVGSFEDDQMQGHWHADLYDDSSGAGGSYERGGVASGSGEVAFREREGAGDPFVGSPADDGTNGTSRTGDETRPFAAGVLKCIKT